MKIYNSISKVILTALLLSTGRETHSKVNTSGLFDFRYQDAEMRASYATGTQHTASPNFTVGQMTLFLDGSVSEDMFYSGEIQADLFSNQVPQEHNFKLRTGSVTILGLGNQIMNLEVGRFNTVQGTFVERRLGLDNPLMDAPLAYSYRVNLDPDGGFVPNGEVRNLSIIDKQMVQTGMRLFGNVSNTKLDYDLVIHNNAISNPKATNTNNTMGSTVKLTWRGDADSRMGISFSQAGYMDSLNNLQDPTSAAFRGPRIGRNSEAEYKQTVFSAFLDQRWHRFDFHSEFIDSTWETPNLARNRNELSATNYYAELKYSFTKTLFAAGRYDVLDFDNRTYQTINVTPRSWDFDVNRTELGMGTYLNPNALAKVSYQINSVDTPVAIPRDYNVISGSLTVAF